MGLVVEVPLNTSLADLDEALRGLLRRELERHGFEGVEMSFDAPSREWSGKLTGPTISLFLYDLREAVDQAESSLGERRGNGQAVMTPPDLRLEATYAITAWSNAVEDEHRLLSQLLAILHSHRRLPAKLLDGRLAEAGVIETVVGRPMNEKADFWTAVGGHYKPSIDLALRLSVRSGAAFVRGPEVRTQTLQTVALDGPRATMVELYRFGGTISDRDGDPVGNAWVAMPESGAWTSTNPEGRFVFDRVRPGVHRVLARTAAGAEVAATIAIPGENVDLVIGSPGARAKASSRKRA
jgi:Pvc16 N-terminal domain